MNNRVIRASAGTGKTYRISLEYIRLLLTGVPFGKILVITFTRKATAEIRERVFGHLELLIKVGAGEIDSDAMQVFESLKEIQPDLTISGLTMLVPIYEQMVTNKQTINISTIDSFVQSIFTRLITPYLRIYSFSSIDESQNEAYYDQVLTQILENRDHWKKYKKLLGLMSKHKTLSKYVDLIKELIQRRWLIELLPSDLLGQTDVKGASHADLISSFQNIVGLFESVDLALPEVVTAKHKPMFTELVSVVPQNGSSDKVLLQWILKYSKELLGSSKFWVLKYVKEQQSSLELCFSEFQSILANLLYLEKIVPFRGMLQQVSELVYREYDALKFREKQFTFQDIATYSCKYLYDPALSLIDDDGAVLNIFYELLTEQIDFLLVDEFQDTSVLQWRVLLPIIRDLTSDESLHRGVTCVGDEKQAIYAWRGGERRLLLNLPKILETDDVTSLSTCYRSQANILRFVNHFFSTISKELDLSETATWDYEHVDWVGDDPAGAVELSVGKSGRDEPNKWLEELVEKLSSYHQSNQIQLDQTVILVRKNDEMSRVALLCEENGLPFLMESASSILDYPAVRDIVLLLTYLCYGDTIDLLRWLRSGQWSISKTDLKRFTALYQALDKERRQVIESYSLLPFISELIPILGRAKEYLEIGQLVRYVIKELAYSSAYGSAVDGGNLFRFVEMCDEFDGSSNEEQSLVSFLAYLEDHYQTERFRQVGLESSGALRIMTIHKAKGLEFDNVFFYWEIGRSGNFSSALKILPHFNMSYSRIDAVECFLGEDEGVMKQIQGKKEYLLEASHNEFLEEINNVYVALTRAKKFLHISFVVGKKLVDINKVKEFSDSLTDSRYFLYRKAFRGAVNSLSSAYDGEDLKEETVFLGQLPPGEGEVDLPESSSQSLDQYLDYFRFERSEVIVEDEHEDKALGAKSHFVERQLVGTMAHYYLSFVKQNIPGELSLAKQMLYKAYGARRSKVSLDAMCQTLEEQVRENKEIFDPRWIVFNERILYHDNREYRLDRMMIDPKLKVIWIVDYKTGEEKHQEQLNLYQEIVELLPFVQGIYSVEKVFFLDIEV